MGQCMLGCCSSPLHGGSGMFESGMGGEMAFTKFKEWIDKTILHEIYPPITAIDKGNFDNVVPETN